MTCDSATENNSQHQNQEEEMMNNTTRTNTPIIDFDDWAEDPFTDVKESDVFSPFHDVGDAQGQSALPRTDRDAEDALGENGTPGTPTTSAPDANKRKRSQESEQAQLQGSAGSSTPRSTTSSSNDTPIPTAVAVLSYSKPKNECVVPCSRRKKKPKGMPKRPLSAYNLYFQAERSKILAKQEENGDGPRIGFEGLGKIIGKQWRDLSSADKILYEKLAEKDSERYRKEMEAYNEMRSKRFEEEEKRASDASLLTVAPITEASSSANGSGSMRDQQTEDLMNRSPVLGGTSSLPPPMFTAMMKNPPAPVMQGATNVSFMTGTSGASAPTSSVPPQFNGMDVSGSSGRVQHSPAPSLRPTVSQGLPTPPQSSRPFPQHLNMSALSDAPSLLGTVGNSNSSNNNQSNVPLPPGMEIILSDSTGVDRKYRVHYTCYSMTREAAHKYVESLTGARNTSTNDNNMTGPQNMVDMMSHQPRPSPPPSATARYAHLPPQHYSGVWGL
mmetsp:Transcript_20054/g.36243  ORF Transcript_20054/g.36243 Transcript_20054/m.36243 type:complete len:500 (+) Transcript_20054:153-1652(+)